MNHTIRDTFPIAELLAYGTSEGVTKAWETRRGGGQAPKGADKANQRELYQHIHNSPSTEQLWRQQGIPIQQNLARKYAKGTYDHSKAPKLWRYFTDNAAKSYDKVHGGDHTFSTKDRQGLAQHMADEFHEHLKGWKH